MIKIIDDELMRFCQYLDEKYQTDKEVCVTILHGYITVTNDGENFDFAVFYVEDDTPVIKVAGKVPEEFEDDPFYLHYNLAHEYKHFLQYVAGRFAESNLDELEAEADEFAGRVVQEYLEHKFSAYFEMFDMKA